MIARVFSMEYRLTSMTKYTVLTGAFFSVQFHEYKVLFISNVTVNDSGLNVHASKPITLQRGTAEKHKTSKSHLLGGHYRDSIYDKKFLRESYMKM